MGMSMGTVWVRIVAADVTDHSCGCDHDPYRGDLRLGTTQRQPHDTHTNQKSGTLDEASKRDAQSFRRVDAIPLPSPGSIHCVRAFNEMRSSGTEAHEEETG